MLHVDTWYILGDRLEEAGVLLGAATADLITILCSIRETEFELAEAKKELDRLRREVGDQ